MCLGCPVLISFACNREKPLLFLSQLSSVLDLMQEFYIYIGFSILAWAVNICLIIFWDFLGIVTYKFSMGSCKYLKKIFFMKYCSFNIKPWLGGTISRGSDGNLSTKSIPRLRAHLVSKIRSQGPSWGCAQVPLANPRIFMYTHCAILQLIWRPFWKGK